MRVIEQRAAAPWYRREWQTWPLALQTGSLAGLLAAFAFLCFEGWQLVRLRCAHAGGAGSLRLVQLGGRDLARRQRAGKRVGAGVPEPRPGSNSSASQSCCCFAMRHVWVWEQFIGGSLMCAAERKAIMKQIFLSKLVWNSAAVLGLLAMFATPMNRAVAQSDELPAFRRRDKFAVQSREASRMPDASPQRQHTGPPQDMVVIWPEHRVAGGRDRKRHGGDWRLGHGTGQGGAGSGVHFRKHTVSNEAGGDVVAVLGNVKLETNAVVRRRYGRGFGQH